MKTNVKKLVFLITAVCICIPTKVLTQTLLHTPDDVHFFRQSEQAGLSRTIFRKRFENPEKIDRQRQVDVTYYGLDIKVDPDGETVAGTVHVRAVSTVNELREILLDLDDALNVAEVRGENILSYNHMDDLLQINFTTPYSLNQHLEFSITYGGIPQPAGFGSFVFGRRNNNEPLVWTLSEPFFARTWWPCKDIPEDKADSVDVTITVPVGLTAVSNGVLTGTRNNGDSTRTFFWREHYPISTYLISLAISAYDHRTDYFRYSPVDSMPVELYITPEKMPGAVSTVSALPQTVQMLEIFTDLFGPYPFLDEKYAQVEFGWGGGMEHQTASSLNISATGANEFLVSHELAHQWWGDLITCRDWHHIWLNEGFATYAEGLYLEMRDGRSALDSFMQLIKKPAGTWGSVYRYTVDDPLDILSDTVFDKGAWVLHMLRNVVGDTMFFDILREYASTPGLAYGNAVTEDFQEVCEMVYGGDLDWFFAQWVYGEGRPHYRYSWNSQWNGNSYDVTVKIDQVQDGILFTMPLDIFIHGADGRELFTIMNNDVQQEHIFTIAMEPVAVTLDDSNKVLRTTELVEFERNGESADIPELFTLFQNFPNPFNPATIIRFRTRKTADVSVKIYSAQGREIKTVIEQRLAPGLHRIPWDGTNNNGIPVAGGVYFVRMTAESFIDVKKMALIR